MTRPATALGKTSCTPLIAAFLFASLLANIPVAKAADGTWNTNSGGQWTNPNYWTPNTGSAPGSTNSTTSADVATFGDVTTAVKTITADSNRNIFGIVYSNNSFGYVVGNGAGSILLSDGGYIRSVGSAAAVTNTNSSGTQIIIQGSAGTASFLNDSANATMTFLGDVAGAATTGNTTTLHLGGSNNTVTNVFNVLLTDGTNGGKTALVVDGGNWNFLRNSSAVTNAYGTNFTGGLTVNAGYVTTAAQRNYGTGLTTIGATSGSSNATLNLSLGLTNALLVRAGSSNNTLKLEITNTSGTATVSSPLTLQRDLEVNIASTGSVNNFTGAFDGTGTLTKTGSGTMTLNMAAIRGNTITYAINGGTLSYANPTDTMERNRIEVGSGGLLSINTSGIVIAGLDGSGVVDFAPSTGARILRLGGAGSYNFSGTISNTGAGTLGLLSDLKDGGVQVLSGGSGGYKGNTTVRSGTLALDYTTDTSSKINSSTNLLLWYGSIDLRGGASPITQQVTGTTLQYGQSAITRSSGTAVLSLGGIAMQSGGALDIGADNIATTTSANVNGVLGSARITLGGANFAKNDGAGNIVGLSAGDYTTTIPTGTTSTSTVYSLTDGLSRTNNLGVYGLKISTTQSGQVLNLGTANFTQGSILFTGANDYTIQSTGSFGTAGSPYILNYGAGKLTLDIGLGGQTSYFEGIGVTKLNKNASGSPTTIYLAGGTLEFSSNAQLGLESGGTTLTIAGGKLLADTTAGNILLTTNSGGGYRNIGLGGGNATIDVKGGNALTIGGTITNIESGGANMLTLGSATASGKIVLGGVNTFTGDVKLAGGTTSISADNNLGNTNNMVVFTGDAALQTTASFGTARYVELRSGKTGTFAPQVGTVLTVTNYIQGSGALTVDGSGTLELLSSANSYTGKTTIKGGTLRLGSGASIAKSSEVNLGTTNAPGTLDLTANSTYAFGQSQTVSGVGTISIGSGKTVTAAGIVAPGNSTGKIIVGGNFSLTSTSEIKMELAGTGGVAGTDFDQIDVSGYVLTAAGTLTITGWNGYSVNQTANYNLFDFSTFNGNFATVTVGGIALTYDNLGSWKGTSADSLTTYDFGIDDGILSVVTVPEPSTYALLGMSALALAAYRVRRRIR